MRRGGFFIEMPIACGEQSDPMRALGACHLFFSGKRASFIL
jgi:hypothetical protein